MEKVPERTNEGTQIRYQANKEEQGIRKTLAANHNDCLEFARISRYRQRKHQFNWSVIFWHVLSHFMICNMIDLASSSLVSKFWMLEK